MKAITSRFAPIMVIVAVALMASTPVSADAPFLEYERYQPMAPGENNRFVMRWWTDGRVEISVPPYARHAGQYELQIGDYDIDGLEQVLESADRLQLALQEAPSRIETLNREEVREVFDADVVRIRTHPDSRSPVDVEITSPELWASVYPQQEDLGSIADLDRLMMNWIMEHVGSRN
jgi:hypothetical protein